MIGVIDGVDARRGVEYTSFFSLFSVVVVCTVVVVAICKGLGVNLSGNSSSIVRTSSSPPTPVDVRGGTRGGGCLMGLPNIVVMGGGMNGVLAVEKKSVVVMVWE